MFSLPRWLTIGALAVATCTACADELGDVQRLYYAGRPDAAMQRADRYLAEHPKDPQMRFVKGVMLADAKQDAQAIEIFRGLTQDYPDLAEPYNNLAALYAAGGDYAKARATLEVALRTNPGYATAHENLGDVHAALAAESYARAIQLDPGNVGAPPKLALVRKLYKRPSDPASAAIPAVPQPAAAASQP